jgi:DNA-binding NarL/FixJ family response regulator
VDIRLFVIEPNTLRRRRVGEAASRAGLEIAGSVGSLEEALVARNDIEVFLIAVDAIAAEPGALAELAGLHGDASMVLFGSRPDLDVLLDAAPAHIRGYLAFNHLSDEEFARSLDIIAHGGAVIEPLSAALLLEHLAANREVHPVFRPQVPSTELTAREEEVVEYVRQGLSNKEIALEMHISLGTVRAHLRSIFRKLEVSSRAGAAAKSLTQPRPSRGGLSHTA